MSQENGVTPPVQIDPKPDRMVKFSGFLNTYLAVLVAVYSVATAAAAYMANTADSLESDEYVRGIANLSNANLMYADAARLIDYDYRIFNEIHMATLSGEDPAVVEYLNQIYTAIGREYLDNNNGNFDQGYLDLMWGPANQVQAEADAAFESAQAAGQRSDKFQVIVLSMAVGLSFTGWASLANAKSNLRWVFTIAATLILLGTGINAALLLVS